MKGRRRGPGSNHRPPGPARKLEADHLAPVPAFNDDKEVRQGRQWHYRQPGAEAGHQAQGGVRPAVVGGARANGTNHLIGSRRGDWPRSVFWKAASVGPVIVVGEDRGPFGQALPVPFLVLLHGFVAGHVPVALQGVDVGLATITA